MEIVPIELDFYSKEKQSTNTILGKRKDSKTVRSDKIFFISPVSSLSNGIENWWNLNKALRIHIYSIYKFYNVKQEISCVSTSTEGTINLVFYHNVFWNKIMIQTIDHNWQIRIDYSR